MCIHGNTTDVYVTIDATLSHTGKRHRAVKPIDTCIASIVEALENGEIKMLGSCCGHGKGPGEILLIDGRKLRIEG